MGIFILNKMEIIETYKINGRDYHTVETKYGLCRIYALDYKKGHRPTIQTALDKRLYFENMARDVHKVLGRYHYIPQLPFAGSKSECFKILGI